MKQPKSHIPRAMQYARDNGALLVEKVEHYDAKSKRRHDLFGFADLIVVYYESVLLVQVTSGDNHAARLKKCKAHPYALSWLWDKHRRLEVWSFRKSARDNKWKMRVSEVSPDG